jgi:hypothetical protein
MRGQAAICVAVVQANELARLSCKQQQQRGARLLLANGTICCLHQKLADPIAGQLEVAEFFLNLRVD